MQKESTTYRVLVISNYRSYHTSRPEAEIFIGLAKMGVQVFIMTFGDADYVKQFMEAGIKIIDFHPRKKFDKQEIRKIRETIIENNINILHLFNSKAIINGIRAARGLSVKVVLYRGYAGNVHWYDPTSYLKYLHPRVDKIICNSVGVEKQIQKQFLLNKNKTVTIPKGHDTDWYKNVAPYDIRKELKLPDDTFLLVSVANNRKMKGIPFLLEGFSEVPDELPIHLLLIGRNMDSEENLSIIEHRKIEKKVHVFGHRDDVLSIVKTCDALVLASIKGEAINRSLAEAMSMGIPPLVSNISGNNEIVEHNKSGLLFPPGDSKAISETIMKIYHESDLRKKIAQNAKARMTTEYNHKNSVLKTKAVYDELLSKKDF